MKYIGIISLIITLAGILIGGAASYAKLEARVDKSHEKVSGIELKVATLEKDNNDVEKNLVAIQIEQKYIKEGVEEANENIKALIKKIR